MSSTFNLSNRVFVKSAAANVDYLYGPYSSTAEACAAIPIERRMRGLTVGVQTENDFIEYQWKMGVSDGDLVSKINVEAPALSYVPEYPEGQTIRVPFGNRIRIGFRFTSPNYGQCQITIRKDGEVLRIFKTDKGPIEVDLGVADTEGTFMYTVTGIDSLSIPAEEILQFKVVVGGIKLSCDFGDRLEAGINTSTLIETIFSASVADTEKTIKVKGEVVDMTGATVGQTLQMEGQSPSYAISGGHWIIGTIPQWGTYTLTIWAYTGIDPDDTSGDNVSDHISYAFSLLNENDFELTSSVSEVNSNTNTVASVPFNIESGGLHRSLVARGELYNAIQVAGEWVISGDPIHEYDMNRSVIVNVTNYWSIGKISPEGDYMAKMWATTQGGESSPIPHEPTYVHVHVDRYESDYSIETNGLMAQFTAQGKSNNNDRDTDGIWRNDVIGSNIYFELHGLNYNTNGWKHVDPSIPESEEGETMLSFTGESYGILKRGTENYNPMSLINSYSGFTTEVIFRSRCIGELDSKVLTSHYGSGTNSAGYSASYGAVSVGSDSAQIRYNVAEDDWIHATLVIDKEIHTEGLSDIQDYAPQPLITVYINGSMCTSIILTNEMTFNNIQDMVLLNSAFNPAGNNIDFFGQCEIKAIRFYNRALLAHEVVKNYVASIYSDEEKRRIDGRNGDVLPTVKFININDIEGITPDEQANGVQLINFEELNKVTDKKLQKKRYVHARILYQEPGQSLIEWDHCIVQTQGTSSLAYPVKNYKITIYTNSAYKKKQKTDAFSYLGWSEENKFTLKCDYMEAAHLNNTPSCIFYNDMIDKMVDSDSSISGTISNGWTGEPFEQGSTYDWTKDARTPSRRGDYAKIGGVSVWKTDFDAIKGFPCIVNYFESQTEYDQGGNGVYVGTYMFNLDKSAASLGFDYSARKDVDGETTIPITNFRSDPSLYSEYDPEETYNSGDIVSYNDITYIANDDNVSGEWNPGKWDAMNTTVKNVMQSFEGVANKSNSAGCFYSFEDYKESSYHDDYCQTAYAVFLEQHPSSELTLDEFITQYAGSSTPYAIDSKTEEPLYLLTKSDYVDQMIPYDNEYEYFAADYEARYDYDDLEEGGAEFWGTSQWGLKRMIDWVSSASADLNRFRNEFPNYFDLEYCIIYYLQMIVFGQVDNAGKNSMWDTWDGLVWRPRPYDLDTATGLDNSGFEAIGVDAELIRDLSPFKDIVNVGVGGYSEDVSPIANARYAAYNTRTSKFWIAFATAFQSQIASMYGRLRSAGIYGIDYICKEYFGNTSDIIGESYYNRDMTTKFYKLSDIETYITRMHGNRVQKFKDWMTKRLVYCDTLFDYYNSTDSLNGNMVLRSDAYTSGAPVSVYLSVQSYSPQYVKVDVGSTRDAVLEGYCSPDSEYEDPNRPGTKLPGLLFRLPLISGNKEIQVSGAGNIRLIGNLQGLKASSLDLGPAIKLTNLDLSGSTKLVALSLSNNKYLQYLNCQDCVQLGTDASGAQLNLSNCMNIKEVNVNNTKLTSIAFPVGGSLKSVYAQNTTITGLSLNSCQFLNTIDVTGCENILTYEIINCPTLTSLNVDGLPISTFTINDCANITNISLSGCNSISTLNITNCPKISSLNFMNNQSPSIQTLNLAAINGLTYLNISGSNSIKNLILPQSIDENFKTLALSGSTIENISYDTLLNTGIDMSRLTGLTSLTFNNCTRAQHIFGLNYTGDCANLFNSCTSLIDVAGTIETTGDANHIFYNCQKLTNISNVTFNFNNCTRIDYAFSQCYALPLSQVKYLFDSCSNNLTNINMVCYSKFSNNYSTSEYTTLPPYIFGKLTGVTTATYAFGNSGIGNIPANAFINESGSNGLQSLSTASLMFCSNSRMTSIPTDILKYMPSLTNVSGMFRSNSNLAITLPSNFFSYSAPNASRGYSGITNIRAMFYSDPKLVVNIGNMGSLLSPLTNLTDAGFLFAGCTKVTGSVPAGFFSDNTLLSNAACCFRETGVSGLPTAGNSILRATGDNSTLYNSLTDVSGMFYKCTGITSNVPSTLFAGGTNITTIGNTSETIPGTSGNVNSRGVFDGCTGILRFGEDFFNQMPNLTNISYTFNGCTNLIGVPGAVDTFPGTILNSHTKISNAQYTFADCKQLVINTLPNLFASSKDNVRYVDYLFKGCVRLTGFNNEILSRMSRLSTASHVFDGCTGMVIADVNDLTLLDGDTSLTNTSYMFYNCQNISGIIPSSLFDSCRSKITNTSYMFYGCYNDQNSDGIKGIGVGNEDIIPPTYNPENIYNTGSKVYYEGKYYIAIDDNITGEWNPSKWEEFDFTPVYGLLADCLSLTNTSHMFDECRFMQGKIPWDIFWTPNIEREYSSLENCSYMFYQCGFDTPTEANGIEYMIHPDFFIKLPKVSDASYMFGKNLSVYNSSVYPKWSSSYPIHTQAFYNMYNLTNIRGMFIYCIGLGGAVSNQWFINSISTITEAREVFLRTNINSVADDFLRTSTTSKNTKLTNVGKMFYACSHITSNLPPMNNINAFSRIDYSNVDVGYGGYCYGCTSAANYSSFADPWNRYYIGY